MLTRVPLRAVIFDWDGTLLNSYHADAQAFLKMFRELDIPWSDGDFVRHYSPDWHNVYRGVGLPVGRWAEADRLWRHFYRSERPRLQAGTRATLQRLSDRFSLALVSSGSAWRVRAQLRGFALSTYFKVSVFGDEIPRRKPHPAQLRVALQKLGVEPRAAVYVGDAPEDVMMAHRAGVAAVGVRAQSPVAERLLKARPEFMIANIADLPRLLWRT
jgi:HAD superfamily hydrolase (TIGR01509 family)